MQPSLNSTVNRSGNASFGSSSRSSRLQPIQRHVLLCAAIVALSLISFYVHVLQTSVERGHQLRAEQRSANNSRAGRQVMAHAPAAFDVDLFYAGK